jgi:hypothetical protein
MRDAVKKNLQSLMLRPFMLCLPKRISKFVILSKPEPW